MTDYPQNRPVARQSEQRRKACVISAVSTLVVLLLTITCVHLMRGVSDDGGGGGGEKGGGDQGAGSSVGPGIEQGTGRIVALDAPPQASGERADFPATNLAGEEPCMVLTDRLVMSTVSLNPGTPPPAARAPGGRNAGIGRGRGGGSGGGQGKGRGEGEGSGNGTGVGETTFMGIRTEGRTFVYIVDCSGSMAGDKLDETKAELIASIRKLTLREQQYFVFFYNSSTYPWPGPQRLRYATKTNLADCEAWANSISAGGGTEPSEALLAAIQMEPDVIYFMSDGLFDDIVCSQVRKARGSKPTAIHTVSFVDKSGESIMRRIAEENGGTYRFESGRKTAP